MSAAAVAVRRGARRPCHVAWGAGIALLSLAVACGERQERGEAAAPAPPSGAAPGIDAMPGMPMRGDRPEARRDADLLDRLRSHLDSVIWLEPNRLVFVRAAHDSLTRRALDQMQREMERMDMAPASAWQALEDSLRRDLAALPTLSGEPFVLRMRGHAGRLRRLLEMHRRMTSPMEGM